MSSRRVAALVEDLFFSSRIEQAIGHLGIVGLVAGAPSAVEAFVRSEPADVVLVDMDCRRADWEGMLRTLREIGGPSLNLIAFGPHRDLAVRSRALEAGATSVIANSKLVADLPRILAGEWSGEEIEPDRAELSASPSGTPEAGT